MKTRLPIMARAFLTRENGYMFASNNRWRLPTMVERTVWDVLDSREQDADRLARWRTLI